MALRLKRGTNAERLNYTPELGELIYVTNYSTENVSPLWVGDGSTVGGNEIINGGGITDLVNDTSPELGGNLNLNSFDIVGIGDIDISGNIDITGNLLANTVSATTVSGNFSGDLTGSVFGDDSTTIIDGINNSINTNQILGTGLLRVDNGSGILINDVNDFATLAVRREDNIDISDPGTIVAYGTLRFERDDINGLGTGVYIQGGSDGFKVFTLPDGSSFNLLNSIHLDMNGNLGVGKTPTTKLDIDGNAAISGSLEADAILLSGSTIDTSDSSAINVVPATTFNSDVTVENNLTVNNTLTVDTLAVTNFQTAGNGTPELESDTDILLTAGTRVEVTQSPLAMASFTTTERNALTPQNGDVIYNTTDSKFQGYAGGIWVNLH